MRFVPGCGCCSCLWTFTVRDGCVSGLVVGAVVSVKQGGVEIAHGTTAAGTGQCVLDVPAGNYDVTVTPPAGWGLDAYSATLSHTCSQSSSITLPVDSDHTCQSGCPCKVMPNQLALTFNVDPTQLPRCINPDDATMTWDPVKGAWTTGGVIWTRTSDGHQWTGALFCTGVFYTLYAVPVPPETLQFVLGTSPGGTNSCNPFSIVGAPLTQTNCGTWSAVSL